MSEWRSGTGMAAAVRNGAMVTIGHAKDFYSLTTIEFTAGAVDGHPPGKGPPVPHPTRQVAAPPNSWQPADAKAPVQNSAFYAVEGIDIQVKVSMEFRIHIDLGFFSITLNFHLSFEIAIAASVQVGLLLHPDFASIRGSATVSINIMGHGPHFGISIAAFPGVVRASGARGLAGRPLHTKTPQLRHRSRNDALAALLMRQEH